MGAQRLGGGCDGINAVFLAADFNVIQFNHNFDYNVIDTYVCTYVYVKATMLIQRY